MCSQPIYTNHKMFHDFVSNYHFVEIAIKVNIYDDLLARILIKKIGLQI